MSSPFSKPTLPQDRTPKQRSAPAVGGTAPPNLWMQSLILHAPLIGLGFGLATGLCLLAGISLRILLSPEIHATPNLTDQALMGQSGAGQSGTNSFSPTNPTDPGVQQTDTTRVRIVVPAAKSFQGNTPDLGVSPPSSKARTIALLLGGGGLALGGIGFWSLRWIRRQSTASGVSPAASTNAIVLHPNPSNALTSPSSPLESRLDSPIEVQPVYPPYLPPPPPPVLPTAPGLPLDPSAITITYQTEPEVWETPLESPSEPPIVIQTVVQNLNPETTPDPDAEDLAHLMDIRKRRPHS
jgi:hypothetical protein